MQPCAPNSVVATCSHCPGALSHNRRISMLRSILTAAGAASLVVGIAAYAQGPGDTRHAAGGGPDRRQRRLVDLQCRRRDRLRVRLVQGPELPVLADRRHRRALYGHHQEVRRRSRLHQGSADGLAGLRAGQHRSGRACRQLCRGDGIGHRRCRRRRQCPGGRRQRAGHPAAGQRRGQRRPERRRRHRRGRATGRPRSGLPGRLRGAAGRFNLDWPCRPPPTP